MGLTILARVVVGTPGCFECTRTGELFVLTHVHVVPFHFRILHLFWWQWLVFYVGQGGALLWILFI